MRAPTAGTIPSTAAARKAGIKRSRTKPGGFGLPVRDLVCWKERPEGAQMLSCEEGAFQRRPQGMKREEVVDQSRCSGLQAYF